jgi:creatinine amidohydrolase
MRWDELTADAFTRAVVECGGVCLVPVGCFEQHAHHLPVGTDMLVARELSRRAADLEPAIVFPDVYFGQILEARHLPGAIGIDPGLILQLLEASCREIARNGLKKIVLVNGHGGNTHLLWTFVQAQLATRRDYQVFLVEPKLTDEESAELAAQWESDLDGHAGESETSQMLALRPELVAMDRLVPANEGRPRGRYDPMTEVGAYAAIWFYADHPTHYCGNASAATAEKGERFLDIHARAIPRAVTAIKADTAIHALQGRFFDNAGL